MNQVWTMEKALDCYDVDINGYYKPSAILEDMCNVAELHSIALDAGRETIVKIGIVWVLVRVRVRMEKYPEFMDKITIKTWAINQGGRIFTRYCTFHDENDNVMGVATSVWLLMDLNTRQVVRAPESMQKVLDYSANDIPAPMSTPLPLRIKEEMELKEVRKVRFSDLDVNNHMNNTRYAEWMADLFGKAQFDTHVLQEFQINYTHESAFDREIALYWLPKGEQCLVRGADGQSGESLFEIDTLWKAK